MQYGADLLGKMSGLHGYSADQATAQEASKLVLYDCQTIYAQGDDKGDSQQGDTQ